MIRRILHAELSDVRALASDVRRRAVNAFQANVYLDVGPKSGCMMLGPGRAGVVGAGYVMNDRRTESWPPGSIVLTIGRVTLAAWGGRPS